MFSGGPQRIPPISVDSHISVLSASGFCSPERGSTKLLIKYVCHGFVETQSHKAKFQEMAIIVGQTWWSSSNLIEFNIIFPLWMRKQE